ncbi:MAG: Txe/YoeB family addiction module toxin [Clostridiaceae bacterium]|jgi:toxin YoeB|nr:Txe/YoeB family addiction module toxin [Clostridiaceae bacterium]
MVNYQVRFTSQANKDKKLVKQAGLEEKARELLKILMFNPFQNPPPYEKLVGNLGKFYSRRINVQHRLVYEVIDKNEGVIDVNGNVYKGYIKVIRMWSHYDAIRK